MSGLLCVYELYVLCLVVEYIIWCKLVSVNSVNIHLILTKTFGEIFLQSCKHESWVSTAKCLMDDVPLLLKSENLKDLKKVLSVVFTSLPSNFGEFIKWVAEVRREEDAGESLSEEERARLVTKVVSH